MKPGETTRPVASTVSRASSPTSPMVTIRPSLIPRSPRKPGRPVPSTMVPLVILMSSMSLSDRLPASRWRAFTRLASVGGVIVTFVERSFKDVNAGD
jgi:hypothetical protein